jgi:hypothetical protein
VNIDDSDDEDLDPESATWRLRFRATLSGDRLTIVAWQPVMHTVDVVIKTIELINDPGQLLIADIGICRTATGKEFIVSGASRKHLTRRQIDHLLDWGEICGYERMWTLSAFFELDPASRSRGIARVQCPCCGAIWSEDSPEFWDLVRQRGLFPAICASCGGDLPQWSAADAINGSS